MTLRRVYGLLAVGAGTAMLLGGGAPWYLAAAGPAVAAVALAVVLLVGR